MDSKKLEILLMAVDLGSFTKTAEVIGYTQSGLTHMMDSLEKEIGFPLLERGHSGVRLTGQGERLIPAIREFMQANANLDNTIRQISEQRETTIKVAAYASIAMQWLPGILYQYRSEYPDVDVDLRMVDHAVEPFELLEKGKMDIIFASRQSHGTYEWIPLYDELMYAVLPENYPVKDEHYFDVREFEGQEFLMPYGNFDADVMRAVGDSGVRLNIRPTTVDDATVIRMVAHGLGVSIMAELMLRGRTQGVRCIPLRPSAVRELGMAVHSIRDVSEPVRGLMECVRRLVPDYIRPGSGL